MSMSMSQSLLLSSTFIIPSSITPPPTSPIPFPILSPSIQIRRRFSPTVSRCQPPSNPHQIDEEDSNPEVQDLLVPDHWLLPEKAREESEWLKVNLHKWLDDEYCPEETNVEISKVAARSYHQSLLGRQTDVGEILLKMAKDLESISYQESFHGAFSSANAAVNLIVQRIHKNI